MKKFNKTIVLTFPNNKGGAGKTSVSANVGRNLSLKGYKILFVDADMQGNLTQTLGFTKDEALALIENKNLAIAISKEDDITDYILKTKYENIDLVSYHEELASISNVMFLKTAREHIFQNMFKNVIDSGVYDFIITDVNPSLDILTYNAVDFCDYAISPIQISIFGTRTIPVLMRFLNGVYTYSDSFKRVKFFLNGYDKREGNTSKEIVEFVKNKYGDGLFETIIPVDINFKKSQGCEKFVDEIKKNSSAVIAIDNLVEEILNMIEV